VKVVADSVIDDEVPVADTVMAAKGEIVNTGTPSRVHENAEQRLDPTDLE
jgi:serine acetyltransferase